MAATLEVKYFNSFLLRKTVDSNGDPVWKGSNPDNNAAKNWIIEESRIRGGYNNTSVDFGAKAYLVADTNKGSIRSSGLIYSGIFNSRTGINNTNQFPVGEEITRSLDPSNGSIQRLHAENTNLTILQENKVSRALIDKDAIYTAEGSALTTSGSQVIGQVVPYAGEYGISKDPGSFAVYGYRKYFTDKNRNAVLRLSADGITEISAYGMKDFFRDKFDEIDLNTSNVGTIVGGFDVHTKTYVVSLQNSVNDNYDTLAFDEGSKGWISRYSYKPDNIFSLKNNFYSTFSRGSENSNANGLWKHYFGSEYNKLYGQPVSSSVTTVFNPKVSLSKNFLTIGYEGSNGWQVDSFVSDATGGVNATPGNSDRTLTIKSYNEGEYIINPVDGQPVQPANYWTVFFNPNPPYTKLRAGFDRKENKYVSNIKNNSIGRPGEVIYGQSMSGIKGMFATVKFSVDSTTDPTGKKELFAVSTNYVESSY